MSGDVMPRGAPLRMLGRDSSSIKGASTFDVSLFSSSSSPPPSLHPPPPSTPPPPPLLFKCMWRPAAFREEEEPGRV